MTVKVKPLVWGKHPDADEYYSPVFSRYGAEMGCYIVSCDSTGADWLVYINRNMMDEYHPTIEAAKAAAQADYEARILAAIEAPDTPAAVQETAMVPEIAALIEAARNLVCHDGWGTVNYTDNGMWFDAETLRAALRAIAGDRT